MEKQKNYFLLKDISAKISENPAIDNWSFGKNAL
jgi:hypothetical protein